MTRMGRQETTTEKIWRYRGVLLVISVPLLLIVMIMLGMPRSPPGNYTGAGEKYAVVIDAGSTGSRVHIFRFNTAGGTLELETDTFEQLKPGLSSYAENPALSARSLKPLLDKAVATVPLELQGVTSVEVRATAGLRLLPGGQADAILKAVRSFLKTEYPFKCSDASVTILDGADEGAFAWLTLNYLLGHLGGSEGETVAAIDMGGGSVQLAYAVDDATARQAPSKDYIYKLKGGGRSYNVYVRSQLGFGIMAGRAAVLGHKGGEQHSCLHRGFAGTYNYGGKAYPGTGVSSGPSFDACSGAITQALKVDEPCGAAQGKCSFNGAWGGGMGRGTDKIYVSSYLFDRGQESGIISSPDAIHWDATPAHYKEAAHKACAMDVSAVKSSYPKVQEEHAPYFCMDLSYAYSVLVNGFKIPETAPMTMVKQIEYKGENLEAQWPLGAAINSLS